MRAPCRTGGTTSLTLTRGQAVHWSASGRRGTVNVGEVAALAGVTVRTLHHYDRIGLLSPSGRTSSGYRQYAPADLGRQHRLLRDRMERTSEMLAAVEKEMEARTMGISLTPEERFEVFGEHDPSRYDAEVEERWGETEAYAQSNRRTAAYTKDDWLRIKAEG